MFSVLEAVLDRMHRGFGDTFVSELARQPDAGYRLENVRTRHVLADTIEGAFTAASGRRGLLGRDTFSRGSGLIIAPCRSVHTFGMRFPIDLVFVSRDGRVRRIVRELPRSRIAVDLRAFAVIELPAGRIAASDTALGDTLRVRHCEEPNARNRRELP